MTNQQPKACTMEIDDPRVRPSGSDLAVVVDYFGGLYDRELTSESRNPPGPVEIRIGERKKVGRKTAALLPNRAPDKQWTGKDDVTVCPTDSFVAAPYVDPWRLQFEVLRELLSSEQAQR